MVHSLSRRLRDRRFRTRVLLLLLAGVLFLCGFFLVICTTNNCAFRATKALQLYRKTGRLKRSKEPVSHLTIISNSGQLGNQMGTYATLYGLARFNGRQFCIPQVTYKFLRRSFQITSTTCEGKLLVPLFPHSISPYLTPTDVHIPTQRNIIVGHRNPSSYTFFHHIEAEIRREFTFWPQITSHAQGVLSKLAGNRSKPVFVGVHVRRGNYMEFLKKRNAKAAGTDFYWQAMQHYKQRLRNLVFVVTSDDRDWCRTHLEPWPDVVVAPRAPTPAHDLALLAACNHSIIAYGTFGFWGAYLSGGDTVYFTDYILPGSCYTKRMVYHKKYLPQWTGISTTNSTYWEEFVKKHHVYKKC